jgi:hypothetical protein
VLKNYLFVGEKQRLIIILDYENFNFKFYSSNNKVARIDYMGYVTALSKGYFYVIITDKDGFIVKTTFLIKVEKNPYNDESDDESNDDLIDGGRIALNENPIIDGGRLV